MVLQLFARICHCEKLIIGSIHTFYIPHYWCKDTVFILVTRCLHMVVDLSLSNRLFKIYSFTHYRIYTFVITFTH